jgi:hypothetical protein
MNQIVTAGEDQKDAMYKTAPENVVREIIRIAELQLQAQLTVTMAANQRAATLCGIFTTASVAALGGAAAAINTGGGKAIIAAAFVAAAMLFTASVLCVRALWPADFYIAGNQPKHWLSHPNTRASAQGDAAASDPPRTRITWRRIRNRRVTKGSSDSAGRSSR